jgi:hypothetical protein
LTEEAERKALHVPARNTDHAGTVGVIGKVVAVSLV